MQTDLEVNTSTPGTTPAGAVKKGLDAIPSIKSAQDPMSEGQAKGEGNIIDPYDGDIELAEVCKYSIF